MRKTISVFFFTQIRYIIQSSYPTQNVVNVSLQTRKRSKTNIHMYRTLHNHMTLDYRNTDGCVWESVCLSVNIHTPSLPSSGHGPLADACRPSLMIHGKASCCRAVLNHWAEQSLCVIKAQRAGRAVRAAAPWTALCPAPAQQAARRKQVVLYVALLLIVVLLQYQQLSALGHYLAILSVHSQHVAVHLVGQCSPSGPTQPFS